MKITFEPLKTRDQIARELNMSTRYLRDQIKQLDIDLSPRIRINIKDQITIYTKILGHRCLKNTEYKKFIDEKTI